MTPGKESTITFIAGTLFGIIIQPHIAEVAQPRTFHLYTHERTNCAVGNFSPVAQYDIGVYGSDVQFGKTDRPSTSVPAKPEGYDAGFDYSTDSGKPGYSADPGTGTGWVDTEIKDSYVPKPTPSHAKSVDFTSPAKK